MRKTIEVIGAKHNNLKNISVEIPRDKLIVVTGISGSGKSSLAFDVIYGEAQRRFLGSISNFAKSRISQVKKPNVESVKGLSPVIAIEQKKMNNNPRSTIGTVTDINDYLRLLYAAVGVGSCPVCGRELKQITSSYIAEHVSSLKKGTVAEFISPYERVYGDDYETTFNDIRKKGYKKLLIDGKPISLSDKIKLDNSVDHKIEIVVDRYTISKNIHLQIAKSIESAIVSLNSIYIRVEIENSGEGTATDSFYENFGCPEHHYVLCELQPFHFSFNTPSGACKTCLGVGKTHVVEARFLVSGPEKSIRKGALKNIFFNSSSPDSYRSCMMYSLSVKYGFSLDIPFNELPEDIKDIIFYGTKGEKVKMLQPDFSTKRNWIIGREFPFQGIVHEVTNWYRSYIRRTTSDELMEPNFIKDTMIEKECPDCKGARLEKQRLSVIIDQKGQEKCQKWAEKVPY